MNIKELQSIAKDIRVLIVEDDEIVREFITRYCKKLFKMVDSAKNGVVGLKKYEKNRYDLVITDINMPMMNGLEMSREIRKIYRHQEIIIISAYANSDYFVESIKIGVSGYIIKPIEYEQINDTIYNSVYKINEYKEVNRYRKHLEEIIELKSKKIKQQYITDRLTSLLNRTALIDRLKSTYNKNSLIILKIDDFSTINKSYGIVYADNMLKRIAKVLANKFYKQGRLFFKLTAGEYAILCEGSTLDKSFELASNIKIFFHKNPLNIENNIKFISFTMGISEGAGIELLKNAILALEEARYLGNSVKINSYHPNSEYEQKQKEQVKWLEIINEGITKDLFVPFYQPIFNNMTKKIDKYECLARLLIDDEVISPFKFLEPLRVSRNLSFLTKTIIDKSFAYMSSNNLSFSINITEQDLFEEYLEEFLEKKMQEYGINPSRVVIEILENITLSSDKQFLNEIRKLKNLGVKISIDDFGTQSSNFSRLLEMDVDFIKIDGSFIKKMDSDERSRLIVKTIVEFAKSINAKVIAEFVSSQEIQKEVEKLEIEFSQGYLFGKPIKEILV